MKKLIGVLVLTLIVGLGQITVAQTFKFGHINSDELFMQMPERDSVIAELEKHKTELDNLAEIMQVEYNNKYNDYANTGESLTDLVRQTKEEELVGLQQKIQEFGQRAQQDLQNKQMELMQPVLAKAEKAIKDVAKAGSFTYIFDLARGPIIYFDETISIDILPLVKVDLGIE
ncbi:MAG: OmpH family outer membrane protein [Bacteroidales bacterium]|nr:OmpH family outer membrane protein [Bacteroidales bacterium]